MSDPVTNVEIEDVLSSIRKLVSDGDKSRLRDPAPVDPVAEVIEHLEPETEPAEARPDKLVLTPAFLVPEPANTPDGEHGSDDQQGEFEASDEEDGWTTDSSAEPDAQDWDVDGDAPDVEAPDDDALYSVEDNESLEEDEGPIQLTNVVWPEPELVDAVPEAAEQQPEDAPLPEPAGRSDLVATIAELEAAMGDSADEFEPDGSELSGLTVAWPKAPEAAKEPVEDADVVGTAEAAAVEDISAEVVEEADHPFEFSHRGDDAAENEDVADDLDGLDDMDGITIDEEALRELVGQVVREELTGPLGERITRNVRKLVRREIYRILSSQEFD